MNFKEVEFKYRADEVPLREFRDFCEASNPIGFVVASGFDYFYDNQKEDNLTSFCRYRLGADMNQLTFKRKLTSKNNYIRTEHNIDLDTGTTEKQVAALCEEFGYKFNTSIFKSCFVYKYDKHTLVYYICYSADMLELGRFIEIEARETYLWESDSAAMDHISELEGSLSQFGIKPQGRIKRSLYEMFRK